MLTFERALLWDIPLENVWRTFTDFDNWGRWLEQRRFLSKVSFRFQIEEGSVPGPGMRVVVESPLGPAQIWVVREWIPPIRLHIQSEEKDEAGNPRFELLAAGTAKSPVTTECYFKINISAPQPPLFSGFFGGLARLLGWDALLERRCEKAIERIMKKGMKAAP